MKILAEDDNRDLFIGTNNQLGILTEIEATEQACKSAVETQRGELRYNTTRGIPTSQTVWDGIPNQQRFQFYCIQALRAITGVVEVQQFSSEIVENTLIYDAIILTEFGVVTLTGSLFNGV